MMTELVVGIDIAKGKHEVCVKDQSGKVLLRSFCVENTRSDVKRLLETIEQLKARYGASSVVFGMESTGVYHLPLYCALVKDRQLVRLYNPLQSSGYRRLEIRKTSTDRIDAAIIADMLNYGERPVPNEMDPRYIEIRELCRARHRIVEKSTIVKNQIRRCLDIIWPDYDSLFSNPFGTASLALLEKYSTPRSVSKAPYEELYALLRTASGSQISDSRTREIYEHANNALTVPEI